MNVLWDVLSRCCDDINRARVVNARSSAVTVRESVLGYWHVIVDNELHIFNVETSRTEVGANECCK